MPNLNPSPNLDTLPPTLFHPFDPPDSIDLWNSHLSFQQPEQNQNSSRIEWIAQQIASLPPQSPRIRPSNLILRLSPFPPRQHVKPTTNKLAHSPRPERTQSFSFKQPHPLVPLYPGVTPNYYTSPLSSLTIAEQERFHPYQRQSSISDQANLSPAASHDQKRMIQCAKCTADVMIYLMKGDAKKPPTTLYSNKIFSFSKNDNNEFIRVKLGLNSEDMHCPNCSIMLAKKVTVLAPHKNNAKSTAYKASYSAAGALNIKLAKAPPEIIEAAGKAHHVQ